jgi:hypothetical protein
MKAMRKRRDALALSLCMTVALAVWLLWKGIPEVALTLGAGSAALIASLYVLSHRLRHARLILDTSILRVTSAVISEPVNGRMVRLEETVVSTFGVLVGGRVYRWGCEGVYGVRLSAVEIDRGRISLTFGSENKSMRIDLPHGLSDQQAVLEICRNLKYETGVTTTVSGWDVE